MTVLTLTPGLAFSKACTAGIRFESTHTVIVAPGSCFAVVKPYGLALLLAPPPEPAPPLFPPIDVPPEHAARPTIAARQAAPNT